MLKGFQDVRSTDVRSLRGAITYAAGTTGAIGTTTLFTVTGDVALLFLGAKCTTDLTSAGAPTWTLGVTGATDFSEGLVTFADVTGWDAGEWATGGSGYVSGGAQWTNLLSANPGPAGPFAISADILQTISVATITGGVVRWYVEWSPLSSDGNVALHANLVAF